MSDGIGQTLAAGARARAPANRAVSYKLVSAEGETARGGPRALRDVSYEVWALGPMLTCLTQQASSELDGVAVDDPSERLGGGRRGGSVRREDECGERAA
jgi:hypothetical protein